MDCLVAVSFGGGGRRIIVPRQWLLDTCETGDWGEPVDTFSAKEI